MKQVKEEKATAVEVPSSPPLVVMLYGQSKIGLSSLALQFPDVLVLNVSDELRHLRANELRIASWDDFLKAGMDIHSGKYTRFKWFCVAHVGALWEMASDYAVQAFNRQNGASAKSASEASYAVWKEALKTFEAKLQKLARLGNLLLLEHEQAEVRNCFGLERTFVQPVLEKHVLQKTSSLSDCIGRVFMVESGARMVSFQPAPHQLTGSRISDLLERQFVILPDTVPEFVEILGQPRPVSKTA